MFSWNGCGYRQVDRNKQAGEPYGTQSGLSTCEQTVQRPTIIHEADPDNFLNSFLSRLKERRYSLSKGGVDGGQWRRSHQHTAALELLNCY